jgi:23S rRNA pseudouridine2605 synthase
LLRLRKAIFLKLSSRQLVDKGERIAKVMARAGLCSRRDAETWILEGRVRVDGKTLTSPAFCVTPENRIKVDGKPLPQAEATRLWLYYKPKGLVTTHKDEQGRQTIFQNLPPEIPRVISVGRLDLNSEGLLLLTNDGELARYLELPSTGWVRRYRVRLHGKIDALELEKLKKGITIEGIHYGSLTATLDRQQGDNAWLTVSLQEGKNRELRRIFEFLGWPVNRLIRTSYGPFQLGELTPGQAKAVTPKILKDQLGSFLGRGKLTCRSGY